MKATLEPQSLKNAHSLIEFVFPAQKVSFEAQRERKAGSKQTLVGLGSYWKGRKPLILVRATILGMLLPATKNLKEDLAIFEKLMAFDEESLAKRAFAAKAFSPIKLQSMLSTEDLQKYFLKGKWQPDISEATQLTLYHKALTTFKNYEEKASLGKRPEEVNPEWLYAHVWPMVNDYYAYLGICANNFTELVEQFGVLRYGHRPWVGDAFCGGGSIPFEAARIGCHAYASDLNPIACMLTWGAFNLVGDSLDNQITFEKQQEEIVQTVDKQITKWAIEHDELGNRAKHYLYCVEIHCPETGWMIPLSPSWVISPKRRVIAKLVPDETKKCFDIHIIEGASQSELREATKGTVQDGYIVYTLHDQTHRLSIKILRGDFKDEHGRTKNHLRCWEQNEFMPRSTDLYQERLYAIQWIKQETIDAPQQKTYFAAVTEADLMRERQVIEILTKNFSTWQTLGFLPDMAIEPGFNTKQLIHERGWAYWHHLFNPRQLLLQATLIKAWKNALNPALGYIHSAKVANYNTKLCMWYAAQENSKNVFYNQALNTFYNYATRSWGGFGAHFVLCKKTEQKFLAQTMLVCQSVEETKQKCELWITDPPYANAVHYHEITEFFIAWLRKNPPGSFDAWKWDSRRALAIQGKGDAFRRSMMHAYRILAQYMPDNGIQCVMFTHQDTTVWSDMVKIFWACDLQVMSAWYMATETSSGLKQGSYVQGTVLLMLKKRLTTEKIGFKQHILPEVREEVKQQIETMMHLNVASDNSERIFNDADLQMAGYAAAVKVLTAYTQIGSESAMELASRSRLPNQLDIINEIIEQATEVATNLLVPDDLTLDTWEKLDPIERFIFRMMDVEIKNTQKLDNYQNFAKIFHIADYAKVMGSIKANGAQLKLFTDFNSRELMKTTELGSSKLGYLIVALQQVLEAIEVPLIVRQLQMEIPNFLEVRPLLANMLAFIAIKSPEQNIREAANILEARLKNLRFGV